MGQVDSYQKKEGRIEKKNGRKEDCFFRALNRHMTHKTWDFLHEKMLSWNTCKH
jgi:hypothetical protein